MIVYFSTKTGNTKKFVEKLGCESVALTSDMIVSKPFILAVGTYAKNDGSGAVHPTVIEFLKKNRHLMEGVVAGGNRNFGRHFAYAADVISVKCGTDIIHKFELFGNESDVDIVKDKMGKIFA